MTREDEFIGQVEHYLDEYEGFTPLPDAVRAGIRAELPKTKQIGPIGGLPRFLSMSLQLPAPARYGLAAAIVLVAAVIGASFFSRDGTGGPSETPSPTSTAAPTTSGPTSLMDSPPTGDLPAGEYYLDLPAYPARIDFEVPSGWWHFWSASTRETSDAHAILVNSLDTGAANGSGWGIGFTVANDVRVDPCDRLAGSMAASATESVDSLVEAFSSWPGFPTTSVEDVTVGGFAGKRVEITRDEDALCPEGVLFTTPAGYPFNSGFPSNEPVVNQFTLLDVEGSVLVIWTSDYAGTSLFEEEGGASPDPDAHVEDQVQLHGILDSVVITPR